MVALEEFESLRCEQIAVQSVNPAEVPCIETSDADRLCKNPVVSVPMLTYNHEAYIRQAIEGVMSQKTDFEFELVIGEDCSQDKTREICFEYQKRYPDKIRVLWWHENVSKLGGNGRRVTSRCRGEFVAFCEGDDFWTDPFKLQKQVDVFRARKNVGLCFAQAEKLFMSDGSRQLWDGNCFPEGMISGKTFFLWHGFGKHPVAKILGPESFIMTATVMVRNSILTQAKKRYDIFNWRLLLGDCTTWLGCASLSDVYFIKSPMAVYRINSGGAMANSGFRMTRDGLIVRMYYAVKALGMNLDNVIDHLHVLYAVSLFCWYSDLDQEHRIALLDHIRKEPRLYKIFHHFRTCPAWLLMKLNWLTPFTRLWACRFMQHLPMRNRKVDPFNHFYKEILK